MPDQPHRSLRASAWHTATPVDGSEAVGKQAGAPQHTYSAIRAQIQTGDVLLYQGTSVFSSLVRWWTDSPYSHAGLAAWWGDRLFIVQSILNGIQLTPLSRAVDKYDGQVEWWSVRPEHASALDRAELLDRALLDLGKPYSVAGLFRLMVRSIRRKLRGGVDPKESPTAMFCSEYVSLCHRRGGIDLAPDVEDACTTPADIARSDKLMLRAVLHVHPKGVLSDPSVPIDMQLPRS